MEKEQAEKAKARREAKKLIKKDDEKIADVEVNESKSNEHTDVSPEAKIEKKEKKAKGKNKKVKVIGKKHKAAQAKIDAGKSYTIDQAATLLKKLSYADFDETVELHLNLLTDSVKGEVTLPHGTGKQVKVAIVNDSVISAIEGGRIDFDVLIAHPSEMPKLVKLARVLGPKGLMPNPKNGTVSEKPEEAAKKFAGGTLRYKSEAKFPLLHQAVGKVSFEEKQIVENAKTLLSAVGTANIQDAFLKSTMSPSVRIIIQ